MIEIIPKTHIVVSLSDDKENITFSMSVFTYTLFIEISGCSEAFRQYLKGNFKRMDGFEVQRFKYNFSGEVSPDRRQVLVPCELTLGNGGYLEMNPCFLAIALDLSKGDLGRVLRILDDTFKDIRINPTRKAQLTEENLLAA
jgi:hypothetical protein